MDNLMTHLDTIHHFLERVRIPIITIIVLYFSFSIGWKAVMSPDTRGVAQDVVKFVITVAVMVLLPEIVKAIVESLAQ